MPNIKASHPSEPTPSQQKSIFVHNYRSKSAIWRLRFAAALFCVNCLLTPVAAVLLVYSLVIDDNKLTALALGLILLSVIVIVSQWLVSLRTQCPLCMAPVLSTKGCSKHRRAKTLLGSHRLRVALAVLFRGWFHCPYCNEPAELQVRKSRSR